jgi:hypothetical protein
VAASPQLVTVARVMLVIYVALGAWSIVLLVRSFYRPLNPTPEKASALKKVLLPGAALMIGGTLMGIHAMLSKQY